MLSAKRDKKTAYRFLKKALKATHNKQPRVINMAIIDAEASSACLAINVDKNPAYPAAIKELKEEELLSEDCELRQKKYLNNIVEQDDRFPKKLAKYKSCFQYFYRAWRTLRGYEIKDASVGGCLRIGTHSLATYAVLKEDAKRDTKLVRA
jgi:transposase-like protein